MASRSLLPLLLCSALTVHAQTIERSKLGDHQLTCAQLHAEAARMDESIATSKTAEDQGNTTATAGAAAGVAAKVGGATGLFGQVGSFLGSVVARTAADTAAGVAQQTGQQQAQQAAERGRQAQARKEQVVSIFNAKGCKSSDLSYEPPASPAAVAAATAPAIPSAVAPVTLTDRPASLPDYDPDQYFKGKMGGTFGKNVVEVLPNQNRVAVLGFRVAFVTHNSVTAQVRASYLPGRDTSGASSTLKLSLAGVDSATMQKLTDAAYADFLAQLKLAGREVVPLEDIKEFLGGVESTPQPYVKEVHSQTLQYFAPTGMPLWFGNWDAQWGDKTPFQQGNNKRVGEYSQKLNAIVVAPLIVVNFAKMMSSGNRSGLTASAAETGAEMSMRVAHFSSGYVRSEEFRNGLVMKGDEGAVALNNASFASSLPFGNMREVAKDDNTAVKGAFDMLGKSLGMANAGGAVRGSTTSVAESSNATYAAAANDVLRTATGTFAKLFQKYPAQ